MTSKGTTHKSEPTNNFFFYEKLIFFETKHVRILLLQMEHDIMKTDSISYYLLPTSTAMKFLDEKYEYVQSKNK